MRHGVNALITIVLLVPATLTFAAETKPPRFHPGEWQIDSVTTVAGGRNITSSTRVCANKQVDFWKVQQDGLSCKDPKIDPVADGLSIHVHCEFSKDQLHSDIHYHAVETFAKDGNSFTVSGTSDTDTSFQGVPPVKTTAQLHATAHRIGDCH